MNEPDNPARPLYVDLDDTLVAGDTLWESISALIASKPLALPALAWRLKDGKAPFKRAVAERVALDPAALAYRAPVVDHVRAEHDSGRRVVLATGADGSIARAVAEHLGCFDDVLASDGQTNLTRANKLEAIRKHAGGEPFDYAGDSLQDVPVWEASAEAIVVAPTPGLLERIRSHHRDPVVLCPRRSPWPALLMAARPTQWVKNALIFMPLLLAHTGGVGKVAAALGAFITFSLVASAGYLFNDLLDIHADRRHPRKRRRPLASGALPVQHALLAVAVMVAAPLLVALLALPILYTSWLAAYLVLTVAYSTLLKRKIVVDVIVLAGLYTLRLLAGGAAVAVELSDWLLAFSMFLFLSLAMTKRYGELLSIPGDDPSGREPTNRRGYLVDDLHILRSAGLACGYMAILVFALYINDNAATLYHHLFPLWLVCPVLLYWITRIWVLVGRGELEDDPLSFATRDRNSYACFALIALLFLLAGPKPNPDLVALATP